VCYYKDCRAENDAGQDRCTSCGRSLKDRLAVAISVPFTLILWGGLVLALGLTCDYVPLDRWIHALEVATGWSGWKSFRALLGTFLGFAFIALGPVVWAFVYPFVRQKLADRRLASAQRTGGTRSKG
jgi:hypothetical protein